MTPPGKSFFDQFLNDYFAESEEHLASARNSILAIEAAGANRPVAPNVLDELLRNFHSLKGLSAMVGLEEATQLAHHIEDYLKELKSPHAVITAEGLERVLGAIAAMEQVLEAKRKSLPYPDVTPVLLYLEAAADEARANPPAKVAQDAGDICRFVFKPSTDLAKQGVSVNTVRERLRSIGRILRASPQVGNDGQIAFEFIVEVKAPESALQDLRSSGIEYFRVDEPSAAPAASKQPQAALDSDTPRVVSHNVVRVEMNRLDLLMQIAGELVITRFRLDEVLRRPGRTSADWEAVEEINGSMERQLRQLRETVVRIRMVPIGQLFERMRLVVRGLERELGKRAELLIQGADTEIDKVVIERMMDPLVHLVRNAVSHGLEKPHERIAAGKPAAGMIRLSAQTAGDVVIVEVEDDGRGIDVAGVRDRAIKLGWLNSDEVLDSKRLLEILSTPGFTTRDEADLASGRGIGMSAVKAEVNSLAGSIGLSTTEGRGARFTIRLPVTVLIADSLMVTVADHRFAVPQTAVREVMAVDSSEIRSLENNQVVSFRGNVLPLLRLADLFGIPAPDRRSLHVLVIEDGGGVFGIAVDRITGQREIVVRSLTDPLLRSPGVVGATELGDGQPVLIIDPHSLASVGRKLYTTGTPS